MFSTTYYQNKVKVAELETAIEKQELEQLKMSLTAQQSNAKKEITKNEKQLQFYEQSGLKQSEAILKAANLAYQSGEISYADLIQFFSQSIDIKINYLTALNAYNQSVIQYQYYHSN